MKDIQYRFLRKLEKFSGSRNVAVNISDLEAAWPHFPGHDIILECVSDKYYQSNIVNYRCVSYTLLPEGREWVRQEHNTRVAKWAAVIAAILSALGIVVSLLLHFFS